jgi:hypothetical protein
MLSCVPHDEKCSVCPGRFFAAGTLWITLAHILAVYDVNKAKDTDGNIIEPDTKLSDYGFTM